MEPLRLPSYAKINLGLHILWKRKDGFHEIESILQQIDLKDEIEFKVKTSPEIAFHCDNPEISADKTNLCVLAATLLKETYGIKNGVEILLKKTIPAGAGLGGGSSNAAVVLLALNKLWNLNLDPTQLQGLAARIGSDVAFFIHGGTALVRGRGERIAPFALTGDITIVIVFPGFGISTKWAYSQINLDLTIRNKNAKLVFLNGRSYDDKNIRNFLQNDLEEVLFQKYPVLGEIKEKLYNHNAIFASMSGSGSAIFGIFRNRNEALEVKNFFGNQYSTFVTRPTRWGYVEVNQAYSQLLKG
jgi:4-diphosphocytidyl-2-C-methyl-D-erythritol kinase